MAKSLQEQLLAAGAVDKNRAVKLKKEKHKQAKQRARGAAPADEVQRAATRAQQEKADRDRALSKERQAQTEIRALAAQVRQLIEMNRIAIDDGEVPYNFSDNGVVRKVTVTPDQHARIAAGRIAIVRFDNQYALVATPVAEKIAERDPTAIVVMHSSEPAAIDEDDPYADYRIPDDLTW